MLGNCLQPATDADRLAGVRRSSDGQRRTTTPAGQVDSTRLVVDRSTVEFEAASIERENATRCAPANGVGRTLVVFRVIPDGFRCV